MRCPACSAPNTKVIDSRPVEDNITIRRRRECIECAHRFTTYERLGESQISIIKRSGVRELYNREKLQRGIIIACAKRPVSIDQINLLIDDIEKRLRNTHSHEISSTNLGNLVLQKLSQIDEVASIRFASVYKHFKSISEFLEELTRLSHDREH